MPIALGTHVQTSDGQDAGTIDRLILDPATNRIKAAVIHKGFFLPHDVEMPLDDLDAAPGDTLRVPYTADQMAALPEFSEANYTATPPAGYIPPTGYPIAGLYWPAGYSAYGMGLSPAIGATIGDTAVGREGDAALRRQDLENAVVGEGSAVVDRDGEMVGDVHALVFDPDSGRLTGVVVREGIIFTKDVELPATLIAGVDDGVISLNALASELPAQSDR
jgi:uncharacterized protein YrrD